MVAANPLLNPNRSLRVISREAAAEVNQLSFEMQGMVELFKFLDAKIPQGNTGTLSDLLGSVPKIAPRIVEDVLAEDAMKLYNDTIKDFNARCQAILDMNLQQYITNHCIPG